VGQKEAISCVYHWVNCGIYFIFNGMLDGEWNDKSGSGLKMIISNGRWVFLVDGRENQDGLISDWIPGETNFENWLRQHYEFSEENTLHL
jgi:hypothetical protein